MRVAASASGADEAKRRRRPGPRRPGNSGPSASERPQLGCGGPSEIAILDREGRIAAVNHAWRQAFHGPQGNAGVGAAYLDVAKPLLPDLHRANLEVSVERLLSGAADGVEEVYAMQTPGGLRWRHVQIMPISVGKVGRFVAIHDDQTALATTQEALKATSEQLLTARDEERQRIAIELHDSTCQHLAAISLSVARLRRTSSCTERETAILDDIATSLKEASKETRVLSYLMKPRGLEQGGLSAGVSQFLAGFAQRTGLEVELQTDGAVDSVRPTLQHAAMRIVQEALLNANRHAQARRVSVELSLDGARLMVSVADDGQGMGSGQSDPCLGVGIPGMHARARQFSGELTISSNEQGTRVVAHLPLF